MQNSILALLAASAIGAYSLLGQSVGSSIALRTEAEVSSATMQVGSHTEAASLSSFLRSLKTRLITRLDPHSELLLPSARTTARTSTSVTETANAYDISPFAVRAIADNPTTRLESATAPTHRGKVIFTAPDGNEFELYRPLQVQSDPKNTWALLDVDNVIADFSGSFGDGSAELTGLQRGVFPRDNKTYDMREYIEPTQRLLRSDAKLEGSLGAFRDWLRERGGLETFLTEPSTSRPVFSLFHRYLVENGLYANMPLLNGAAEGVKVLHSEWPIRIVTKRYGTGPDFAHVDASVPLDSAKWISDALGGHYDSVTVMGRDKSQFAGSVFAVFEDSVGNIERIRAANATRQLRERAFARGVRPENLDRYLAKHNADVLGVIFRWQYNRDAPLIGAPNVVVVDRWSDAVAATLAYRKLLTDPEAGANGRLHWSEVPGLVGGDGSAVTLPEGSLRAN